MDERKSDRLCRGRGNYKKSSARFFKAFKPHTVNCYVFSLVFALMGSLQGKFF